MHNELLHEQLDLLLANRETRAAIIAAMAALTQLATPAPIQLAARAPATRHPTGVSDRVSGSNTA